MPGAVIDVRVADGDAVVAGQPVVTVEAMKMEHVLAAPADGIVHLSTAAGAQVALDEVLARIVPADADADADADAGAGAAADSEG
jgi:acetyl-CoA/propionyl-CoA carboxylase biotin carboxyl carrier protein